MDTQSCVANASAAALWYMVKKSSADDMMSEHGPSRLYIYFKARVTEPNPNSPLTDSGTWVRRAMKGINKHGVCVEDVWSWDPLDTKGNPTKINEEPNDISIVQAAAYSIKAYYRLDLDRPTEGANPGAFDNARKDRDGQMLLSDLRRCLSSGLAVFFDFSYYWEEPAWGPANKAADMVWELPNIWTTGDRLKRHTSPSKD